jgi:hypothetical protein
VLHHIANSTRKRSRIGKWVSGAKENGNVHYELLVDHRDQRQTALEIVVQKKLGGSTGVLLAALNPKLPLANTDRLTRALGLVAEHLPRELVALIETLEDPSNYCLFRKQCNFRFVEQYLDRTFAVRGTCKLNDKPEWIEHPIALASDDGNEAEKDAAAQAGAISCVTELQVVALHGFVGAPTAKKPQPPYSQLFQAGTGLPEVDFNSFMETKLMVVATAYKWDQLCANLASGAGDHKLCHLS